MAAEPPAIPQLEPLRIGSLTVADPVLLAPMCGITDAPFRNLVRRYGVGLAFSEMIASGEMVRAAARMPRSAHDVRSEGDLAVQLAGCDPQIVAEAARMNVDRGAALIDLNFGCPVKKVVGGSAGSALMRDEALAGRILESVARAVPVPVTVKMRMGWDADSLNAPRIARIAEESGIAMVTVHGRTRQMLYTGTADWRFVAEVKAAVRIPVIVNGDIVDGPSAAEALRQSGADGIMIGRGAQGRVWQPSRILRYLRSGEEGSEPEMAEREALLLEQLEAMLLHYGSHQGLRIARKHIAWTICGLPHGAAWRAHLLSLDEPAAVQAGIRDAFAADGAPALREAA